MPEGEPLGLRSRHMQRDEGLPIVELMVEFWRYLKPQAPNTSDVELGQAPQHFGRMLHRSIEGADGGRGQLRGDAVAA